MSRLLDSHSAFAATAALLAIWSLATSPSAATQSPARDAVAPSSTARVEGRIVASGAPNIPIRNATVTLGEVGSNGGEKAVADDDGRFVFENVPAGRFVISSSRPAYLTSFYGAIAPGRPGTPIVLAPGQRITNIIIPMVRGGVITGVVRDQSGEPLQNARVMVARVARAVPSSEDRPLTADVVTDDRGTYRAYGLMPGDYVVAASLQARNTSRSSERTPQDIDQVLAALQRRGRSSTAASGPLVVSTVPSPDGSSNEASQGAVPIFFPGTASLADASPIRIAAGEERGNVDITIHPVALGAIDGTVSRPGGGPVPELMMTLALDVPRPLPGEFDVSGDLVVEPQGTGRFTYANVPPGRYVLTARSGYSPAAAAESASAPDASRDEPPVFWASTDVVVIGGETASASLSLQTARTLRGRVVFDRTTLDAPADLSSVVLVMSRSDVSAAVRPGAPSGSWPIRIANVSNDGSFAFSGILPGVYEMEAGIPGTAGWSLRSAMVNGRDVLDHFLEIPSGGPDVTGAVVTFTDRRAAISGVLQAPDGTPAAEYVVVAFPADQALWQARSRRLAAARPGTDGTFSFEVPAGVYCLAALTDLDPDEWKTPAFLGELLAVSVKVSVGEGEHKEQSLRIAR